MKFKDIAQKVLIGAIAFAFGMILYDAINDRIKAGKKLPDYDTTVE